MLLAGVMFAAGSQDGPVRKRRRVWPRQQLIDRPLCGEHKVLIEMEKMTDQWPLGHKTFLQHAKPTKILLSR